MKAVAALVTAPALIWQDSVDPELEPDLEKRRAKNVEWILKLIAKVGEEPPEEPTELQERAASLKALDAVAGLKSMPGAWRCKVLLQRVNALTTDEQFEERYTAKQLDEASATLAAALRLPGAKEDERAAAEALLKGSKGTPRKGWEEFYRV